MFNVAPNLGGSCKATTMKRIELACEQGCVWVGGGLTSLMWFIRENHSAAKDATVVKDSLGSPVYIYREVLGAIFWF